MAETWTSPGAEPGKAQTGAGHESKLEWCALGHHPRLGRDPGRLRRARGIDADAADAPRHAAGRNRHPGASTARLARRRADRPAAAHRDGAGAVQTRANPDSLPPIPTATPTVTPIPAVSCGAVPVTPAAVSAEEAGRSLSISWYDRLRTHTVLLAPGDRLEIALAFTGTLGIRFTNLGVVCLDRSANQVPGGPLTYRATRPGETTMTIWGVIDLYGAAVLAPQIYTYTLEIRPEANRPPPPDRIAPPETYPPFGAAPDYSWISGQVSMPSEDETNDRSPPCGAGVDLRRRANDWVVPTGAAWDAAWQAGQITDRTRVVLFGHPAAPEELPPSGLRCGTPFVVDRWLVNIQPAPDVSLGPLLPPGHPIIITDADFGHTVHVHAGDRLLFLMFGISSATKEAWVTIDRPEVLERLTDDPQARGNQVVARAVRRGTAVARFSFRSVEFNATETVTVVVD